MFNRFPNGFNYTHKGVLIDFKNNGSFSFWTNKLRRCIDLIDIIYISLNESCNDHSTIYTHNEIKEIGKRYTEQFIEKGML